MPSVWEYIFRFGLPILFAIPVFAGANLDVEFPDSFSTSIITIDGIFIGFIVLLFSFLSVNGRRKEEAVTKLYRDIRRIMTVQTGVSFLLMFLLSMVLSLAALIHTGIASNGSSIASFLLMIFGITNLIASIINLYI